MERIENFSHVHLQQEFTDLVREVGRGEAIRKVAQYFSSSFTSNSVVQGSKLLESFTFWAGSKIDVLLNSVTVTCVYQAPPVLNDEDYYDPTDKGLSLVEFLTRKAKLFKGKAARRAKRNG